MKWTPELETLALDGWKTGKTAREIAAEISAAAGEKVSRNAVIGKVERLGAPRRRPSTRRPDYINVWTPEIAEYAGKRWANGDNGEAIRLGLLEKYGVSVKHKTLAMRMLRAGYKRPEGFTTNSRFVLSFNNPRSARPKPHVGMTNKARAELLAGPEPASCQIDIWDLRPGMCRWPHGDPDAPGFGFCGHPVKDTGGSYCPHHHARAYTGAPERRKERAA